MEHQRFLSTEYLKLPDSPGVYRYYNKEGKIIYVGKAKNLKKRVTNYFTKSTPYNRKTDKLVSEISAIEITVVQTEFDALLLENNLIKENQPKYNILLKDDKSFPYIVITKERFPKVYSTRRLIPNYGEYFGPFTSVKAMNNVLELIRKLYQVRTCSLNLSQSNIAQKKFKVCLEYHIGNCLGPCVGNQTELSYLEEINQAKQILKGQLSIVSSNLKKQMSHFAENLAFEKAQLIKDKIDLLDKFQLRTYIVNPKITNTEVFSIVSGNNSSYINYLNIEEGSIKASETLSVTVKLDESPKEILEYVIPILRQKYSSTATEIISNVACDLWGNLSSSIPQIGDKRRLLDLSIKNALQFKKMKEESKEQKKSKSDTVLEIIKHDLHLKEIPNHIECFDNSNIQGTNPVASMVCFLYGKPAKREYRHFNIKTVNGPDDFSSMKEIVYRRYKRLVEEEKDLPQLIVIDGGKGQLSAACESLKALGIYGKIAIIGIAKRLEEIYYPEDPLPLYINKKSPSLTLLQFLRDEAHRFAITFHRLKRSSDATQSILDEIKGIGPKSKEILLNKYKSVKRISETKLEELSVLLGPQKATILYHHFKKKEA